MRTKAKKKKSVRRPEHAQILERWRGRLLLNEWHFSFVHSKMDKHIDGDRECLAEISACPIYLTARITIYPAWHRKSREVREHTLVHEMAHCLTQEAWDAMGSIQNGVVYHKHVTTDIIERLTQRITNAVFWREGKARKQ